VRSHAAKRTSKKRISSRIAGYRYTGGAGRRRPRRGGRTENEVDDDVRRRRPSSGRRSARSSQSSGLDDSLELSSLSIHFGVRGGVTGAAGGCSVSGVRGAELGFGGCGLARLMVVVEWTVVKSN